MLRCFVPRTVRFCGRTCATVPERARSVSLVDALKEAKGAGMWKLVETYRAHREEFAPGHCLATLAMMDDVASERAQSKVGYEANLKVMRFLPEVKDIVRKLAAASNTLKPHMFGNVLILTHVFGMEQDPEVVEKLNDSAQVMLPQLTDSALQSIVDAIGNEKSNYWTALVLSYMEEVPKTAQKELPVARSSCKYSERLRERLPVAKLLHPEARKEITPSELARIADVTCCLGAIDPNDLHEIVGAYAAVGLRNFRFFDLITSFAMRSWQYLDRENLLKLYDHLEQLGYEDKDWIFHCFRRLPFSRKLTQEAHMANLHSKRMAVFTKWYRPWTKLSYGRPYAAPEWDTSILLRDMYDRDNAQFQKDLAPRINYERRRQGKAPIPKDGIVCPWLPGNLHGGDKLLKKRRINHGVNIEWQE